MTTLLVMLALSAPLPLKGPPTSPAIAPGAYRMVWQGTPCETHFHADGFFACHWLGRWWNGRWSQAKGRLDVTEWPLGEEDRSQSWVVELSCPRSGMMGASKWSLSPLPGRVR